jgi:hypothetical protein
VSGAIGQMAARAASTGKEDQERWSGGVDGAPAARFVIADLVVHVRPGRGRRVQGDVHATFDRRQVVHPRGFLVAAACALVTSLPAAGQLTTGHAGAAVASDFATLASAAETHPGRDSSTVATIALCGTRTSKPGARDPVVTDWFSTYAWTEPNWIIVMGSSSCSASWSSAGASDAIRRPEQRVASTSLIISTVMPSSAVPTTSRTRLQGWFDGIVMERASGAMSGDGRD